MDTLKVASIQGFSECGFYFQRTAGRPLSARLHCHTFYEFLYVAAGSCTHEANGAQQALTCGNLVLVPPQASHRFLAQTDDTDVIALSVVPDELTPLWTLYELRQPTKPLLLQLRNEQCTLLLSLCDAVPCPAHSADRTRLRMVLNQLFLFCIDSLSGRTCIPPEFADVLERMRDPALTAEGVAAFLRISGYSHSQLCRLTRKYLGTTPSSYVNRLRMNLAYQQIAYGWSDYESICSEVGFESFSYFCRLVKECFGSSPARLRRRAQGILPTV